MATLSNINGKRMIQFPAGPRTRRRRSIRLGRISDKDARSIRTHVDNILVANFTRQPLAPHTAAWLAEIGPELHTKLAKAGLVKPRGDEHTQALGAFLDAYIAKRTDLKPRSIANLKQVRNRLCERFTPQRDLATITRSEMKDWHRWLMLLLAPATVSMHVKKARHFFAEAIDARLLSDNPVKGIKAGAQQNEDRMVYVRREDVATVIDSTDDGEWQLIFALARYQGVRIPSETSRLTWKDVDFTSARLTIRASKTEHHRDKGVRVMPIFPEMMPHLWAARLRAGNQQRVIGAHRGENLRTTAEKLIRRAGLTPWGKLFQNQRASCETDLVRDYGIKAACKWIGNSEAVAMRHYLMVTDADFDRATGRAAKSAAPDAERQGKTGEAQSAEMPHKTQKPPAKPEVSAWHLYPQGESSHHRLSSHKRKIGSDALQKALHRGRYYRFGGVIRQRVPRAVPNPPKHTIRRPASGVPVYVRGERC